jgi:uncharacterized repeat protein (TIGR01451 family)
MGGKCISTWAVAALTFALLAGPVGNPTASAASTVGSFEIEGNFVDDSGPGEPIDWSSPPPGLTAFSDAVRRGDDIFKEGSKELEPGSWTCATGSVPPKDDIRSGAVSFRRGLDGKQYLYVHYFRDGVNGDAHMDYEFNQSSAPNPSCPETQARTDGDIVVAFDTENGGAQIFVRAFEWQGNATTGTLVELALGTQGVLWDGAVNIPNTIPGEEAGSFGEAAINLTDSPVGEVGCGEFGTAYMKTRASTSINAALKDKTPAKAVEGLCPQLELEKSANVGFAVIGDQVTYTLTYRNTGEANATNVTINEPLPAGTAFVSCSDSCTQSGDGSSVSWSLGTVAPGASGSVTLTVRITTDQGCEICNVATIDSDQTSPLPSNQVCITIVPEANPAGAKAFDSAFGARVTDTLLGLDLTLVPVESYQQGPGSDADSDQLLDVNLPLDGTVLRADVMRTSSRSTVTDSPAEATHTSIAETANVDVLGGIVTASAVRGVATATATGTSASYSTLGSAFNDLYVDADGSGPGAPVAYNNVNPGTTVDLSVAFGAGSYVKLYEEIGSNTEPSGSFGGTYAADVTVNMIHVHLTDKLPLAPGDQTADVIVAQAVAHADFPQITLCAGRHPRAVSGHAFIASESTDPSLVPVLHGYVSIPSNGGEAHQDLDAVSTTVLTAESAATDSRGTIDGQSARATSWAEIQSACLLADASGTCTVGASVLRSQSNSLADRDSASSDDDGTLFVLATVLGVPVAATPPPNTVVELPGIGYVILNEQFCDNGAALPDCSDGSGHAGLTVRAVHLVVTVPTNPTGLQPGAEVILDEAHSDATWIP